MGRLACVVLVCVCLLATTVNTAHVVELKKRVMPREEKLQLLELLQLGEEEEDDDDDVPNGHQVPNVKLNSNFFGSIMIGDSHQSFDVVYDTGSSVLWVYGDECETCSDGRGHQKHLFSPSLSHTFQERDIPFNIKYGTGASRGTTGQDNIFVADLEVEDQVFGQCEEPDSVMKGFPFDGIVGLSRSLVNDPNAMPTLIKTIKDEHILESRDLTNTFSFYIGREEAEKTYLIFGGSHDMLKENGLITYAPTLQANIYWEISMGDLRLSYPDESRIASTILDGSRHLEQHRVLTMHNDSYARIMLDPEVFLELDEEMTHLETKVGSHARSHAHSKSTIAEHSETTTRAHHKAHKAASATHDLEPKVGVKVHQHKQAAKKSKPSQGQLLVDNDEASDRVVSLKPCRQDDEHMCIISADSGHSLMSGPPDVIRELKQSITPPRGTECTEDGTAHLPNVEFDIAGRWFTLEPMDYLIELEGQCVPAFSERTVRNGHDWVLGEHFMRTFYTVFDYDNMRVGFAHVDDVKQHLPQILSR